MTIQTRSGAPRALGLAAAAALLPLCASAQGLIATESDLQYRHFFESGTSVVSGRGSTEFSVGAPFAVQGDLILGRINDDIPGDFGDFQSVFVHGVYDMGTMDAGAFIGRDFALGDDVTSIGIEGRFELQGSEIQPWLAYSTSDGEDAAILGLTAESRMAAGIGLESSIVHINFEDDASVTDVTFTAGYEFPVGVEAYGTAGYTYAEADGASDGEASIGLGVRFGLGQDRGTTFGSRSVWEVVR